MDVLVVILVGVAALSFICLLASLDTASSTGVLATLVLMIGCALAAIFIGLSISKKPYTQAVVGSRTVTESLENQGIHFATSVTVFKVKLYKENCLISSDRLIVFSDPGITNLAPDDALLLVKER